MYKVRTYTDGATTAYGDTDSLALFNDTKNEPLDGFISIFQNYHPLYGIEENYIKISKTDNTGVFSNQISSLTKIIIESDNGTQTFNLSSGNNFSNYVSFYSTDNAAGMGELPLTASRPFFSFTGSYSDGANFRRAGGGVDNASAEFNVMTFDFTADLTSSIPSNGLIVRDDVMLKTDGPDSPSSQSIQFPTYFRQGLRYEVTGSVTGSSRSTSGSFFLMPRFYDPDGAPIGGGGTGSYVLFPFYSTDTSSSLSYVANSWQFVSSSIEGTHPSQSSVYTSSFSGSGIYFFPTQSEIPANSTFNLLAAPWNGTLNNEASEWTASFNDLTFKFTSVTDTPNAEVVQNPFNTAPDPYFNTSYDRHFDCQPLLNNAVTPRSNPLLQDVDYSYGIIVPVNAVALLNNTATRATVPESSYTKLSAINIKYDGSKSTSKKLNQWSNRDVGTYGKSPTIESKTSLLAYCGEIIKTPEIENTVMGMVKYIITETKEVIDPNLTDIGVSSTQQGFVDGESINVNLLKPSPQQGLQILNGEKRIVKGGYRVEGILSSEIPSWPWTGSMYFETGSHPQITDHNIGTFSDQNSSIIISAGSSSTLIFNADPYDPDSVYDPTTGVITLNNDIATSGLGFNIAVATQFFGTATTAINPGNLPNYKIQIVKNLGKTDEEILDESFQNAVMNYSGNFFTLQTHFLPASQCIAGTTIQVRIDPSNLQGYVLEKPQSVSPNNFFFRMLQFPYANVNIIGFSGPLNPAQGNGPFFELSASYSSTPYDNSSIISRSIPLNQSYGFFQQMRASGSNIPQLAGVDYPPTSEIFSVEKGDEFRFEGSEAKKYTVKSVIPPQEQQQGYLTVQFTEQLPTASGAINVNQFLIRRYIADGSSILFESNMPNMESGPAFIAPKYASKALETGSNDLVTYLSEKSLLL
tara:strand:- start:81 stop:2837 length:2757 start_codon:yes stop_codon:yes gene_type:complete